MPAKYTNRCTNVNPYLSAYGATPPAINLCPFRVQKHQGFFRNL